MSNRRPWRVVFGGGCFRVVNIATFNVFNDGIYKSLAQAQEICDELNILSNANIVSYGDKLRANKLKESV